MDIQTIKELWIPQKGSKRSGVEWWNNSADRFAAIELPTAEKSIGMRIIEREKMAGSGSTVLDVGCGGGRFSFALENMGAAVTGTDFSPKMIEVSLKQAEQRGSKVEFVEENWHTADLKQRGWEHSFDLVLANMTPAVVSADTFMKLSQASRKWVLMVKPTRRTNSVYDELNRLVCAEEDKKVLDDTLAYAFDLAWLSGYCPRLEYQEDVWEHDWPVEDAVRDYTLRIGSMQELTKQDEANIRGYLESIAADGMIHDVSHIQIVAMYWQVKPE